MTCQILSASTKVVDQCFINRRQCVTWLWWRVWCSTEMSTGTLRMVRIATFVRVNEWTDECCLSVHWIASCAMSLGYSIIWSHLISLSLRRFLNLKPLNHVAWTLCFKINDWMITLSPAEPRSLEPCRPCTMSQDKWSNDQMIRSMLRLTGKARPITCPFGWSLHRTVT